MTDAHRGDRGEFNVVSQSGFRALPGPAFVIEVGGKYYATAAVLEYNPDMISNSEQRKGVDAMAGFFAKGTKLQAVQINVADVQSCQATKPPNQNQ